jgi:hypothetical protein
MGFYYNSGQPPEKDKSGGWREVFAITWAVFTVLALPLGFLFGAVVYLMLMFLLFSVHTLAGLGWIGLAVGALVARGVWEAKRPSKLQ